MTGFFFVFHMTVEGPVLTLDIEGPLLALDDCEGKKSVCLKKKKKSLSKLVIEC